MKFEHAIRIFDNVSGASFVGIDTLVTVSLTGGKKNPMQGRVTKRTIGSNVMVFQNKSGSSYEAMVKRRLIQEGKDPDSFQLSERKWGTRIPNTPFIEHVKDGETKHYLEVIFFKAGDSEYFLDGKPILESEIEGLSPPTIRDDAQGSLENMVIIRSFLLDSIIAVRIDGVHHTFA